MSSLDMARFVCDFWHGSASGREAAASAHLDTAGMRVDGVAAMVPDEWMPSTSRTGWRADCVATMAARRAFGVDEISTYGTSPAQNAGLVDAWRTRSQATTTEMELQP